MAMSKPDRISQLPDDLLCYILSDVSNFTVRDAVNASTLSRRWNRLCASVLSNLIFDGKHMFPELECRPRCTNQKFKDRFVRGVNQFLQYYRGSTAVHFRVSFCLRRDSTSDIDSWISLALNVGVEHLYLNLNCMHFCIPYGMKSESDDLYIFRHGLLSQRNYKLRHLGLASCILGPGVIDQFTLLITLNLVHVHLCQHEVESILVSSLNLESLKFADSKLPEKLFISGLPYRLKFLAVLGCSGLDEIKLSATNLTRFEFAGEPIKFSFCSVPNLKSVHFRVEQENNMQMHYIFGQLAKDLPLINTLSVFSNINWVQWLPVNITTFSNLKNLEFSSLQNLEFDIRKMTTILEACPLLEKFSLMQSPVGWKLRRCGRHAIGDPVHKNLKEIHIGGFCLNALYFQLVIYLMEYAVVLERMVIDPQLKLKFYTGKDCWLDYQRMKWAKGERFTVCAQLQKHPKSALIVIL